MTGSNFWRALTRPILGISPMDGVTDVAFRTMTARKSTPSVIFTEFVPVEGLQAGVAKLLESFLMVPSPKIPQVAQIYGTSLEGFYSSTLIICALGYDGVDINMGCPAKSVTARGAGAGLIRTPLLASEIIATVRRATQDFCHDPELVWHNLPSTLVDTVKTMQSQNFTYGKSPHFEPIPVSVKTRTGYDNEDVEGWIGHLLSQNLDNISLHGRTLKQGYTGIANREALARAGVLVNAYNEANITSTTFLANGDFRSLEDAKVFCQNIGVSGVLFGRVLEGNPWFFTPQILDKQTRLEAALEHTRLYMQYLPNADFRAIRKHLMWYARDFPQSAAVRVQLAKVSNIFEVEAIVEAVVSRGVV